MRVSMCARAYMWEFKYQTLYSYSMCLPGRPCIWRHNVHVVRSVVILRVGEFGAVYKGTWKNAGKQIPIAIKTLKVSESVTNKK